MLKRYLAILGRVFSIHALLAESDNTSIAGRITSNGTFLSTLSLRRATQLYINRPTETIVFLSTLSLRRATIALFDFPIVPVFSIHALLAESDGIGLVFLWWGVRFLSTLSLRRATLETICCWRCNGFFYPRSPCGERPNSQQGKNNGHDFLSTLSLRRATLEQSSSYSAYMFSIHALLAESDSFRVFYWLEVTVFYPRSPCGERRTCLSACFVGAPVFYPRSPCGERQPATSRNNQNGIFLSTLSLRRATLDGRFKL